MRLLGALGGVLLIPICIGLAFITLFVTVVGLSIPQLPPWAQSGVNDWMLGKPQPVGSETGDNGSSPAGVGVGWDGYVEATDPNPPDGLPLAETPMLGCLYHDPAYSNHTGVDFPAAIGTPVAATMAGKVVWVGENGPWGNLVVIENNGYQIWLAHLSQITVRQGQVVGRGEVVGAVGSTGNSTGPHLHYGILQKTAGGQVWLDPLPFLGTANYLKVECK